MRLQVPSSDKLFLSYYKTQNDKLIKKKDKLFVCIVFHVFNDHLVIFFIFNLSTHTIYVIK